MKVHFESLFPFKKIVSLSFFATMGGILLLLYAPLILNGEVQSRDDQVILGQVQNWTHFSDYFSLVRSGKLFDLNPLRDLSFKLDLWLLSATGFQSFHLQNVLWWVLSLFVLNNLLEKRCADKEISKVLLLLFATHPSFVNAVAWISARKHLLAFFFVLLATFFAQTAPLRKRDQMLKNISFGLALCSQPIIALWPLWMIAVNFKKGREPWRILVKNYSFCMLLSLICIGANYWYYSNAYLLATSGVEKFVYNDGAIYPKFLFLALGRYFYQLILPFNVSPITYDSSNWEAPVGLVLLCLALVASIFPKKTRDCWTDWLPFFLPLTMVSIRPTWVFVSDTYLLWPGLGICLVVIKVLPNKLNQKLMLACLLPLLGIYLSQSLPLSRAWLKNSSLWAYAYEKEPMPHVKLVHAQNLLKSRHFREAMQVTLENLDYKPYAFSVFAEIVLEDPEIADTKKEELFAKMNFPSLAYQYRWSAFMASRGDFRKAYSILQPYAEFIGSDPYAIEGFDDHAAIAGELLYFCFKAESKSCGLLEERLKKQLANDPAAQEKMAQRKRTLIEGQKQQR